MTEEFELHNPRCTKPSCRFDFLGIFYLTVLAILCRTDVCHSGHTGHTLHCSLLLLWYLVLTILKTLLVDLSSSKDRRIHIDRSLLKKVAQSWYLLLDMLVAWNR